VVQSDQVSCFVMPHVCNFHFQFLSNAIAMPKRNKNGYSLSCVFAPLKSFENCKKFKKNLILLIDFVFLSVYANLPFIYFYVFLHICYCQGKFLTISEIRAHRQIGTTHPNVFMQNRRYYRNEKQTLNNSTMDGSGADEWMTSVNSSFPNVVTGLVAARWTGNCCWKSSHIISSQSAIAFVKKTC